MITKKEIILLLETVNKLYNINTEEQLAETLREEVPVNALKTINKYIPLKDLGIFNLIYSKRHKTPLYKNFIKGDIDDYEKVVCLGSLLSQMLCYIKTTKDDPVKYSEIMGIQSVIDAINDFVLTGSFDEINKVYNLFSNLFRELFTI